MVSNFYWVFGHYNYTSTRLWKLSIGITGYFLLVLATRKGDVSVVAPFRYSRLIFSLGLASLILGEKLTLPILLGGLLVVSSGIHTFGRERRLVKIQKSVNQKI